MIYKFKRKMFADKDMFSQLSKREQEVKQIEEQVMAMTKELH
jgi:hypothetical protein